MSETANSKEQQKENDQKIEQQEQEEDWEIQRNEYKAMGDDAFRTQNYSSAIQSYTLALSLDPNHAVLLSNRSAAYLKNNEKSKALHDAQKLVEIDKSFLKGYSRLGAALYALGRYQAALETYETLLQLQQQQQQHDMINNNNSDNHKDLKQKNNTIAIANKGIQDCQQQLERIQKEKNCKNEENLDDENNNNNEIQNDNDATKSNDDDDEDDLLNSFFDDVEEVVTKKKESNNNNEEEENQSKTPSNAIKHEKEVLGTTESQMERLLQTNYEWKNLNPFFVLQLPHTASLDDISKRYKALSLLLHPDKHHSSTIDKDRIQLAYDQVQKAKQVLLGDSNREKHVRQLVEEGHKIALQKWKQLQKNNTQEQKTLEQVQETETFRVFAQVEQTRRDVERRERNFEQRQQQQQDETEEKERKARKFDKEWRQDDRVDQRIGNWRDFDKKSNKKRRKMDK